MGTWGTGISSNDTFADIYETFFELYNEGFTVKEISKKLISENQETINSEDDSNNFWFALAKAQWESKELDDEVYNRVKTIIETEQDLKVWRELDADEKDIKKRKIVLDKFLNDLQTEKPKAKARKKKVIRQPLFEKGDCLTFKLENGNYCGAVVLEDVKNTEYGLNLIAATRINQKTKPTLTDFENAEALILSFANWQNKPEIGWYYLQTLKKDNIAFEVVEKIKVEIQYEIGSVSGFYFGGSTDKLKEYIENQFKYVQTDPKPERKITIKELTKKKFWKFWK